MSALYGPGRRCQPARARPSRTRVYELGTPPPRLGQHALGGRKAVGTLAYPLATILGSVGSSAGRRRQPGLTTGRGTFEVPIRKLQLKTSVSRDLLLDCGTL